MSTTDKLVADVMEKVNSWAMSGSWAEYSALESAIRSALAQAVKDAVGEPVAEVKCWEEPRYEKPPRQMFDLTQLDGFRSFQTGTHLLYAIKETP